MANNPSNALSFIVTTLIWDVIARINEVDVTSPEFKELLVRLSQYINNLSLVVNLKDTGIYSTNEIINGQKYFPNPLQNSSTAGTPLDRQVYRMTINFGALPNRSEERRVGKECRSR